MYVIYNYIYNYSIFHSIPLLLFAFSVLLYSIYYFQITNAEALTVTFRFVANVIYMLNAYLGKPSSMLVQGIAYSTKSLGSVFLHFLYPRCVVILYFYCYI